MHQLLEWKADIYAVDQVSQCMMYIHVNIVITIHSNMVISCKCGGGKYCQIASLYYVQGLGNYIFGCSCT